MLDRYHRILEAVALSNVIVDIAGCNQREVRFLREFGQALQTASIALDEVVLDFDKRILGAKDFNEMLE